MTGFVSVVLKNYKIYLHQFWYKFETNLNSDLEVVAAMAILMQMNILKEKEKTL
jgi:hypothetical protein